MKVFRPLLIAGLMLTHLPAHAASFDCNRGRSLTEKMICNDPALSRLDDTLGQLYWKARRQVINRRAFLNDSDSKWAWREENCRDAACLGTWYTTRIGELERLIETLRTGEPTAYSAAAHSAAQPLTLPGAQPGMQAPATPVQPLTPRKPPLASAHPIDSGLLQCTAARPGLAINDQCSTVLGSAGNQWKYQPRGNDWFCGVATLEQPSASSQAPSTSQQTQVDAAQ